MGPNFYCVLHPATKYLMKYPPPPRKNTSPSFYIAKQCITPPGGKQHIYMYVLSVVCLTHVYHVSAYLVLPNCKSDLSMVMAGEGLPLATKGALSMVLVGDAIAKNMLALYILFWPTPQLHLENRGNGMHQKQQQGCFNIAAGEPAALRSVKAGDCLGGEWVQVEDTGEGPCWLHSYSRQSSEAHSYCHLGNPMFMTQTNRQEQQCKQVSQLISVTPKSLALHLLLIGNPRQLLLFLFGHSCHVLVI